MNSSEARTILGRVPADEFVDREVESQRIDRLCREKKSFNAVLLGAPRIGKSEILRRTYDRLFAEGGEVFPLYFSFSKASIESGSVAQDYMARYLAQLIAFRRDDPGIIRSAQGSLAAIGSAAAAEDYLWIKELIDLFVCANGSPDAGAAARSALASASASALHAGITPFVMLDNVDLLADPRAALFRSELLRTIADSGASAPGAAPAYLLCGLRRPMVEMLPADEELFDGLELMRVEPLSESSLERLIRQAAANLKVEITDSTAELMIQQLGGDLFYIRSVLGAAASRGSGLRTFMDFERVYTEELLAGRIGHYFDAVLRDLAPDGPSRKAAIELLGLVVETDEALPLPAVRDRLGVGVEQGRVLLARLHALEMIESGFDSVKAAGDGVLADYVRARRRSQTTAVRPPLAGFELLGEKLKASYKLMMNRYNRAVESQLVEVLSRFDFQSVPASVFDQGVFDQRYRGQSRVQVRRLQEDESERVRLPQIVLVTDLGSGQRQGVSWRLFAARGFEGGIYSEANEVLWLIALANSKEPLDLETLDHIDSLIEAAAATSEIRGTRDRSAKAKEADTSRPAIVRWYVSKEGFSAAASAQASRLPAHRSTYAQLDLLHDHLVKSAGEEPGSHPASEFELVIPIEADSELIAARTVEQIARAADFDQESTNQIKTALIEACINAAEHGESPDRRIHQRFSVSEDRLTITVTNKGNRFAAAANGAAAAVAGSPKRGRGLQIIRALMDEVKFDRTDDGTSLVMVKFLKRPQQEQ
jgi:serine/threonine-protein kinase RsbW